MQTKISYAFSSYFNTDSLTAWVTYYYQAHIESWTLAVTKHFQKLLKKTISPKTQKPYKASLRHFGC